MVTKKQELIEDFFMKLTAISKIDNPLKAMKEYVKLQEHLSDIYEEGFKQGKEVGIKIGTRTISN